MKVKNTNKVLGLLIALSGAAVSIGGSLALYTRAATSATVGISAGTYTGSDGAITYKINGDVSGNIDPKIFTTDGKTEAPNTVKGLNDTYTQMKYTFPLSATYDSTKLNAQSVTLGKITVSFSNCPSAYQGTNGIQVWAGIEGYADSTWAKSNLAAPFGIGEYFTFDSTGAKELSTDIAVASAGGQSLVIWVKKGNYTPTYTTEDEAKFFDLTVSWGKPNSTYERAYVRGNGNQWKSVDEYAMTPSITSSAFQWSYDLLDGKMDQALCYIKKSSTEIWEYHTENHTLELEETYTVTWSGEGTDAATFTKN